jgi:predicted DNA-binding transcriptional regulator AlpA
MSVQFLTNITEQEFRKFLKDAIQEVLAGVPGALQEQPPEILDAGQAALFLKMKIATLYEKTSKKFIPHFKRGNKLYFRLSELQQWICQGKVTSQEEIKCRAITLTLNKKAA